MSDAITAKLVRRFGTSVTSWAAELPALVAGLATGWDLTVGEPFANGASSVAFRVTTADGVGAVLKLSPDLPFVIEQVAVLRLFAPGGRVPDVLAHDPALGAVLLSEIRPGTAAIDLLVPPTPTEYADLLLALHSSDLPVPGLLPRDLRSWTDEFLHKVTGLLGDPVVGAHLSRDHVELAARERDRLLASPPPPVLLHADLHFRNVLDGGRARGLMAIDPKACVGDPCLDAVDYVTGGAGLAEPDGVGYRLDALATAYGLDPDRLLAWCRVVIPGNVVPLLRAGRLSAADELLTMLRP